MAQQPLSIHSEDIKTRDYALPWLFLSERDQPMTRQTVNYIITKAGEKAGLGAVNPHMLRHSCGFYLANNLPSLQLFGVESAQVHEG